MNIVNLDGRDFKSLELAHRILQQRLGFPNEYGKNANALWDYLTFYTETPVTIKWHYFKESQRLLGEKDTGLILKQFQDAAKKYPKDYIINLD